MPRIFLPPEAFGPGGMITIGGGARRHLVRVLRLKPGDTFIAVNGEGGEFTARLVAVEAQVARAEVVAARPGAAEPPVAVTLLLGLPKGEKTALVIQKATELGVARLMPVATQRSVVRLDGAGSEERRRRWQAIVAAAVAQSGRSRVPLVEGVRPLEEALAALAPQAALLVPWEGERETSLRAALAGLRQGGVHEVTVAVGPEGGWAPEEVVLFRRYGGLTVSLGPRVLRCETAALAALAIILYELGDLGAN